jgi:hypothetical protein
LFAMREQFHTEWRGILPSGLSSHCTMDLPF